MDIQKIIKIIVEVVIIPILPILSAYLVKIIKLKSEQYIINSNNILYNKYMNLISTTITNCVVATNQTYVDALKANGEFTVEAQKEAFNKTYTAVMSILNDEVKNYLINIVGDLKQYITSKIEAEVKWSKE